MQMKDSVVQARQCSDADLVKAVGQMFTKVGLWLSEKEKLGAEHKKFTMDEIRQCFVHAISNAVGEPVTINHPGWQVAVEPAGSVVSIPAQKDLANMVSSADHADLKYALNNKTLMWDYSV